MSEQENELTPMEVWKMVFHPQKGAVATLQKSIEKVTEEMQLLADNLKKYNGLPERLQNLEKDENKRVVRLERLVEKHMKMCARVQSDKDTDEQIDEALRQAEIDGEKQGVYKLKKRAIQVGIVTGLVGMIIGLITFIIRYWPF